MDARILRQAARAREQDAGAGRTRSRTFHHPLARKNLSRAATKASDKAGDCPGAEQALLSAPLQDLRNSFWGAHRAIFNLAHHCPGCRLRTALAPGTVKRVVSGSRVMVTRAVTATCTQTVSSLVPVITIHSGSQTAEAEADYTNGSGCGSWVVGTELQNLSYRNS